MSNHGLKHGQKVQIRSFVNPYFKVTAIFCAYERRGKSDDPEFDNVPKEDCFVYKTKEGFKFLPMSNFYVWEGEKK